MALLDIKLPTQPVHMGQEGGTRPFAWVSFPSPDLYFWPESLGRRVSNRALLRAGNGTLWTLIAHEVPWTDAHLAAANAAICNLPDSSDRYWQWVSAELARKLDAPSIAVASRGRFERDFWNVNSVARAVILRELDCRRRPSPLRSEYEAAVRRLTDEFLKSLEKALSAFANDALNATFAATAKSAVFPFFDPTIYNYLVRDPTRRNRGQLLAWSPLLARVAALGEDRDSRRLRRIVDEGAPLIRSLANLFGCKPASLRTLARKATIAQRWTEQRPRVMARLLDLVPPERHPSSPQAWQRFDELLGEAALAFRSLSSTAAQTFLRENIGRGGNESAASDLNRLSGQAAQIQTLERHLIDCLLRNCRNLQGQRVVVRQAKLVARARLLQWSFRELSTLAGSVCSDLARHGAYVHGLDEEFSPSLPMFEGEQIACDGQRRVLCITTPFELRKVGKQLSNCLASPRHLDCYVSRLRNGTSIFVSIRNEASGRIESVAELGIVRESGSRARLVLDVHQHRAAHSEPPSHECRRALREVIRRARSLEGQQRLAELSKSVAGRTRRSVLASVVDALVIDRLLAANLGEARLKSMVQDAALESRRIQAAQRPCESQLELILSDDTSLLCATQRPG